MRQETTNTFDKGLNKDLNPVITPNDVLTDCLNGTFVTFNGDELTLQNDSGNTTVPVPGKDSVVKLSKGFYPVGIKEYGGVLYIVSGKKGLRDKEGNYIRDEYKRIIEEDQIEFGSYPYPQFAWPQEVENNIIIENYSRDTLYRTSIINDTIFKTGGYVRFSPTSTVSELPDHLWTPQTPNGLYVIKLQHQLESGVYDLTDTIWEKYTEYLNNAPNDPEHWINSENFKFYCPTKYKGKLAVKIELNEPEYFEFEEIPTAILSGDKFDLKIQVKWKDSKALKIIGYNLTITTSEGSTPETYEYNKGDLTSIYTIPLETTILSYEVTPRLEYLGEEYSWDAFPEDFKEKFILQGRMFLGAEHLGLKLLPRDGNCLKMGEIGTGKRQYNTYILSKEGKMFDKQMDLIEEGELTLPAIITLYETEPITEGNIIGTFNADINNSGKISINTEDSKYIAWKEGLNSDLKRTTVEAFENMHEYSIVGDQSCSSQYFYISFNYEVTNLNINWTSPSIRATYVYDRKEGDRNIYKVLYVPEKDIMVESNGRFKRFKASEISPNVVLQVDYQRVSLSITNPKLTSSGHGETFIGTVDNSGNATFGVPGTFLKETNLKLSFGLTVIPYNLIIPEISPSNIDIDFIGWQHSQISVVKLSSTYNINTTLTVKTESSGGGGGPVEPEFPTDGPENIQPTSLNAPQIEGDLKEQLLGGIRLNTVITDEYGKNIPFSLLFNVGLAIIE